MPSDQLAWLGLAERLEQAQTGTIRVKAVHIVDDYRLIPMLKQFAVHTEGRGVSTDPAGR